MLTEQEQKIKEVERVLDGELCIHSPFTGYGNGQVIEIERALRDYVLNYSLLPDIIYVDNIGALMSAIIAHSKIPVFMQNNCYFGGYKIDGYCYGGKIIIIKQETL